MARVLAELLPLAIAVAISPLPIVAMLLLLLSPDARATSLAFLGGWVAGIAGVTLLTGLLGGAETVAGAGAEPTAASSGVRTLLGLLAWGLAARSWRQRPEPAATPRLPGWLAAVETITTPRAVVLGVALSAANPKNLALLAAGGVAVSASGLDPIAEVGAATGFVLVAASTVLVPAVVVLLTGERVAAGIVALKDWLVVHNSAVTVVLLIVIGAVLVGRGVERLAGLP